MPNRKKVERSANYSYYSDLLWCTVPLIGMSWYYYGARPVLLLLAALLTAYLCDCALAPLHGTGYQSHEPSSECFAALIVLALGRPPSRRVAFMPSTRVVFTLPNNGSCVPGMGYEKTSCGHEIPATTTPTAAGWNG